MGSELLVGIEWYRLQERLVKYWGILPELVQLLEAWKGPCMGVYTTVIGKHGGAGPRLWSRMDAEHPPRALAVIP